MSDSSGKPKKPTRKTSPVAAYRKGVNAALAIVAASDDTRATLGALLKESPDDVGALAVGVLTKTDQFEPAQSLLQMDLGDPLEVGLALMEMGPAAMNDLMSLLEAVGVPEVPGSLPKIAPDAARQAAQVLGRVEPYHLSTIQSVLKLVG